MIKTDCFAYRTEPVRCTALNDLYCRSEECHFYKPGENDQKLCFASGTNIKLTPEAVAFIRKNYIPRDPQLGVEGMATRFGVSTRNIQHILSNETWKGD